ncbi:Junctophilin-3 [Saguinus oedipus]|uniref:Junctophilin-3 n=1 Tax=Saguinus oedipus TaxID=9490 RepID=A0ABQ9TLM1_SAGOE|nr:Junctophilin-3 [Saguinus oedipus]
MNKTSCDDIEVLSTGTPLQQESPELYRKGTTPSDLTPDDSPLQSFPASPAATPPPAPATRNKVSVDEERGGDIQMLLEGRDCARSSWGEEQAGGSRGVRSSALRVDDLRARGFGRKQPGNPKPRERRTESPPIFAWTSHHRASNHSPGGARLLELQEEKLSNYRMEMKPLLRMEAQEAHPQKRRYSKGGACRGSGDDHRPDDRGFGVQRLRSKAQNKENFRPASSAEPAVQKLASLRLGGGAEPRLLRWDLTFSPPQKSLPENGDELKSTTVSVRPAG